MTHVSAPVRAHEPDLATIEMVCERLGELGLPVGPETARELVRAILQLESPRVEAQVRDALETSLETIRIAAQSAKGILAATERISAPASPEAPKPVLDPRPYNRKTPAQGSRGVGLRTPIPKRRPGEQSGERRPPPPPPPAPPPAPEPRRVRDDFDGDENRPVFRRPRR